MQALDDIRAAFPGSKSSANVVLEGEPEQVRQAVDKVTQHAGEDTQTYAGVSNTWTSADQRTAVVDIAVKHTSDSAQAHQAVNRLRSDVAPSLGVSRWAVGGDIASGMDYTQNLSFKNPVGGWNRYCGNIHLYVWGLSVYTIGRNHDRVEPCLNLGCFWCSDGYFPRDMGRKPSRIYLHRTCGVLDSSDAVCHSFRAIP